MGRGGLTGIEFGKVKIYGTDDAASIEKLYETFVKVMKRFGYPEEDYYERNEDGTEEGKDEGKDELVSDEEVHEDVHEANEGKDKGDKAEEKEQESVGEEEEKSPWLRATKK